MKFKKTVEYSVTRDNDISVGLIAYKKEWQWQPFPIPRFYLSIKELREICDFVDKLPKPEK